DEDSLAAFGKWPWPRERHADLLNILAQAGPKAIAFDILLSESGDAQTDAALAEAASNNENLFLPLHFVLPGSNGDEFDIKQPLEPFRQAASGVGHVNLLFDRDGVVRQTLLCFGESNEGGRN